MLLMLWQIHLFDILFYSIYFFILFIFYFIYLFLFISILNFQFCYQNNINNYDYHRIYSLAIRKKSKCIIFVMIPVIIQFSLYRYDNSI